MDTDSKLLLPSRNVNSEREIRARLLTSPSPHFTDHVQGSPIEDEGNPSLCLKGTTSNQITVRVSFHVQAPGTTPLQEAMERQSA